jgi:hypothetical protein
MSTFKDDKQLLEEAHRTITYLTAKYKEKSAEVDKLNKELTFFHTEIRHHKQAWDNMFYSASPAGYAYEEEQLSYKLKSKQRSHSK